MGKIILIIILLILLIIIELIVISCCIISGKDPYLRYISDYEQLQYILRWNKRKKDRLK